MISRNRYFTLLELLIVIVIISMLMSVLLPSLRKVKETAKSINCLNNTRQIYVGIALYVQSNDNWMPDTGFNGWNFKIAKELKLKPNTVITGTNKDYATPIGKSSIFVCPAVKSIHPTNPIYRTYGPTLGFDTLALYEAAPKPCRGWRPYYISGEEAFKRFDHIANNSVIMIEKTLRYDNFWNGMQVPEDYNREMYTSLYSFRDYSAAYEHHNKTANFLFKEGHAKNYKVYTYFDSDWKVK